MRLNHVDVMVDALSGMPTKVVKGFARACAVSLAEGHITLHYLRVDAARYLRCADAVLKRRAKN